MMDFNNIKKIQMPEGYVKKIVSNGQTLWKAYDAQVEYLESTGTQYINTGISPLLTDVHHIDFQYTDISSTFKSVYGCLETDINPNKRCHLMINDTYNIAVHISPTNYSIIPADLTRHYFTLDLPNRIATIDSTARNLGTPNIPNNSMYIFARHQNVSTVIQYAKLRIYSFEIVGRLNLIPVRVGTVGYLYDKISGNLLGNSGTGNFILGADVEVL